MNQSFKCFLSASRLSYFSPSVSATLPKKYRSCTGKGWKGSRAGINFSWQNKPWSISFSGTSLSQSTPEKGNSYITVCGLLLSCWPGYSLLHNKRPARQMGRLGRVGLISVCFSQAGQRPSVRTRQHHQRAAKIISQFTFSVAIWWILAKYLHYLNIVVQWPRSKQPFRMLSVS